MSVQSSNPNWPFVVNLGNSIIGVAILAMPFCFKQCGILLGMLVLLFCTWLTLASCQLLVKAGIVSHRRSYEFLAYHTYGAAGKFTVEIGMIGMQFGTLVAQIVVIGDLGPPIISSLLGFEQSSTTRLYLIVILCLFIGLPLGLMKDLRNVSRASTICISFYAVFVVYVLWISLGSLWSGSWYTHVNFWRPQGLFQCLPILSFSFGCQTQLFILYDALPEPSLHAIKSIIHSAVNLCAVTYLLVGFFAYITFYEVDIPGDIITVFPSALPTHLIKLGFVMSIAITFPVIIYPCRASIYTLLFQKKTKHGDDMTSTYIPEFLFKAITVGIVVSSMTIGILIPNVEFILGLNGAITGTLICYIFPALFFLRVMSSKAEGKTIAQMVLVFGVSILLISTFTTLYAQDKGHVHPVSTDKVTNALGHVADQVKAVNNNIGTENFKGKDDRPKVQDGGDMKEDKGKRVEPPIPNAPGVDIQANVEKEKVDDKAANSKKTADAADGQNAAQVEEPSNKGGREDQDADANGRKERDRPARQEPERRQEELLAALEEQRKEQEKLLQEQKELLQELKDHKEQDREKLKAEGHQPAQDIQPPAQDFQQQKANVPQAVLPQQGNQHDDMLQQVRQFVDQGQDMQKPGQQSRFVPVQNNVQQLQPLNNPAGGIVHQEPGVAQVQGSLQQPLNDPVQANLQQRRKSPLQGNQPVNVPAQAANAPVQGNIQQPVNVPVQDNLQQAANVPVQDNLQQAANVPVQGNIQQAANVPVQGNLQQAANVPVQGNLQQAANVPVQGNLQQAANVPVQGNLQQAANVPVQDNLQQLAAQPAAANLGGNNYRGQALQGDVNGAKLAAAQDMNNNHMVQLQDSHQQQNVADTGVQAQGVPDLGQEFKQQQVGDKELLRKRREADEDPLAVQGPHAQSDNKEEMRRKLKSTQFRDDSVNDLLSKLNDADNFNTLKQGVAVRTLKAEDGG